MDMDFAVSRPLVRRWRLVSGSCPSTRTFDPCFFQTPPRGGSPCIITRPSPPSGWPEDFHLQAAEHAQHTTKPLARRTLRVSARSIGRVGWGSQEVSCDPSVARSMLEELQRRNYAPTTISRYLHAVEQFARHFKRPPDRLNQTHFRPYQAYLLRERKLRRGRCGCMSRAALLLREDAEAPVPARRHAVSESPASAAADPRASRRWRG